MTPVEKAPPMTPHDRSLAYEHAEAVLSEVSRGAVGSHELVVADLLLLSEQVMVLCDQVDATEVWLRGMEADRDRWKDRAEPRLPFGSAL